MKLSVLLLTALPFASMASDRINDGLKTAAQDIRVAYENAKAGDPALEGSVSVEVIVLDGNVHDVRVIDDSIYSPKLINRVGRILSRAKFDDLDTAFVYKIYFSK